MQRSSEIIQSVMAFSNENATFEDNITTLEGDTMTLEGNTASDEGNEDLFPASEDRFDDNSDDGLDEWHDESLDDDWLYDSDIPICDNVEGETKPVRVVDVGDVQCNDPIYNNPIADENGICSPGVERFSSQTITIEESTCADDRLYKGRIIFSKAELKRALNMLALKEQFGIRVERSCKARYELGYKDKACKFSVRATKLPKGGEYWQVQTFHKANGIALRPKDIIGEMRARWGLECLYEQENLSTVNAVATDEAERFKYYFWAYEACIRGFRDVIHPMVAIDATHLKDRFKGVLFVAHLAIKKAIQNAYQEAHHGLCGHINKLKQIHVGAHADLMRIGPKRRAHAYSSARRYLMMTSNIAECVNSYLKHARQMPITILIEFIIDMFQHWFHDRYEEAVKVTTPFNLGLPSS
ncbi:Transposase [Theobroma cacao]|nr:Transposase [Theobroma cacao]